MVLNSLTSPGMVAATLSTLGCGARFAEIGKRDIWSPARIAQERPDVRCSPFDCSNAKSKRSQWCQCGE